MTLPEKVYRVLLWLNPTKHRQVYEQPMLQHARDLSRDAHQRGRWHVAMLYLRLIKDGIVNAGIEHMEAIMTANNRIKPAPWLIVLLASLPGLYSLHIIDLNWTARETGVALLSIVLIAVIIMALLRGQRLPGSVWLVIGVMLFGNAIMATLYSLTVDGGDRLFFGLSQYFTTSGLGPLEGLMLVAVGLLAARQHGVLAILVVVGGYSYMFTDTDYLFGYPFREWTGLSAYFVTITILYLVVVPVAFLRAKTRLGRALAVFVPVVAFHVARLTVPLLVIQQPIQLHPGNVIATFNVMLSLILAWVLYSYFGDTSRDMQLNDSLEESPLPN
jgi:hypothetical protein